MFSNTNEKMRSSIMRGILFSITLFRVFAVVQSTRAFNDLPDRVPNHQHYGNATRSAHYRLAGETCSANDVKWYPTEGDPRQFLYCDRRTRKLKMDMCASVNNVAKIFDERFQRCVMPASGVHRTPGVPKSSSFGEPCTFNTDCLNNMYCPTGICLCVAGYIDSNQACVPAVGPGQSRCATDRECRAYWPSTTCVAGKCTCSVPPELDATRYGAREYASSEGFVCLIFHATNTIAAGVAARFLCPLPIPFDTTETDTWQQTTAGPAMFPSAGGITCSATTSCQNAAGESWADMATCNPLVFEIAAVGPPVTTNAQSLWTWTCCPNRAHTCMQPRPQPASGTRGETRYWYNQATGNCENIFWDGRQPWANNFKTREHCLSYCGGICPRGYTALSTNGQPTPNCGTATGCGAATLTCTNVASAGRQICCPTQAYVCNTPSFGRPTFTTAVLATGIASAAGDHAALANLSPVDRYRYDGTTCIPIDTGYTGWGGFYNNFATLQECQSYCQSSACERGEPLKDQSGVNQACGRGCPSTYECRRNICCPKKQTVCIQPRRPGSCLQSVSRFWYNAATRDCEQFSYTGCGGNDNNFESYQACTTFCREVKPEPQCIQGTADKDSAGNYYTCSVSGAVSNCKANYECYFDGYSFGCCPQRAHTCSLNSAVGAACVAQTTRWYYDTRTRTCQTFAFNGCDGNSNNFINRQECERYCGVGGCPYGGDPYKETSGAIRVCNAQVTCPTGHACNSVGVGGSTLNYCCQTRAAVCQQNPLQGSQCSAQLQRYYFNIATRTCSTFTFFGCGGNENNFATLSQCNNFCGSAACLAGEAAYIDPNANRPLSCNPSATNTCPQGYQCRSDTLLNSNVCCGSNDMGICPAGERAYIEAMTSTVRECQPSISSSCPNGYLCRPNNARNRYYCCGTAATNICPAGKAVYRSPDTNQPLACFVSTINQCPSEYSCQPTTAGQSQGYCCTINALCPSGGEYFVETTTQIPRRCTVQVGGFNQCPTGYTCSASNPLTPTNGYCCRSGAAVCGTGQAYSPNGVPQQCLPNQAPFCPANYACTAVPGSGIFYCCSNSQGQGGCPAGTNPFIPGGSIGAQVCTGPVDTTCPIGYSCQLSPTLNRYQCCSGGTQGDGCPPGMVVYREPGTAVIRACTFNGNQCPSPYSCQQGAGRLQCCGLSGGCPSPMVAAINPSTGQPLICTGGASCPFGFQCQQGNNGQMTCCGTGSNVNPPPTRVPRCPFAGQTPYIVPGTGQAQTCRVGIQTCQGSYQCMNGGDGFVCCSPRGGVPNPGGGGNLAGACPAGSSVYVNPVTNQAQTCSNSFVRCPVSYQCRYSIALRNYYCCSNINTGVVGADEKAVASSSNGGCPTGEAPFFPRGSTEPAPCDAQLACPSGYKCTTKQQSATSDSSTKSVCCRSLPSSSKSTAAAQLIASPVNDAGGVVDEEKGENELDTDTDTNTDTDADEDTNGGQQTQCWGTCTPGSANSCIRGYACQQSGGQWLCCRNTAVAAPVPNQQPMGVFRPQQPSAGQFPGAAPIATNTNGGGSGCPSGGSAYNYPGTQSPLVCQLTSSATGTCPVGYRCTRTASGRNLCCPGTAGK